MCVRVVLRVVCFLESNVEALVEGIAVGVSRSLR